MSEVYGRELTPAELSTLDLLSRGLSNAKIAKRLFVAEDTIKSRVRQVFKKLGVVDRAQAVRVGFETGLLSADDAPSPVGVPGLDPELMRVVARALLVSAHRAEALAGVES